MVLLLSAAFATIAAGVDVFGLLRAPGLLLLGRISYSTYILHGSLLFVFSRLLNRYVGIVGMSPPLYWMLIGLLGLVVVLVSAASFEFVEHPFFANVRAPDRRRDGPDRPAAPEPG